MAKIYYRYIRAGLMSIEQVGFLWRDETQALIDADKENKA